MIVLAPTSYDRISSRVIGATVGALKVGHGRSAEKSFSSWEKRRPAERSL